jgi:hypothetical protein
MAMIRSMMTNTRSQAGDEIENTKAEQAGRPGRPAAGQGGGVLSPAPVEAREALWLRDIRRGYTVAEVARRERLSRRSITMGLGRAREREKLSRKRNCDLRDIPNKQEGRSSGKTRDPEWSDARRPPRLVPLFPIGPFTPQSQCPHHGPIRTGSVFCCMVCSRSGMDDHPALQRDALTDPRPEPKPAPIRSSSHCRETRKERRRRLHAKRQSVLEQE